MTEQEQAWELLAGVWEGDKGIDLSPEKEGLAENPYHERIVIEDAGEAENAEDQVLQVLRYHQVVRRKSNDEIFHDQVGYWIWDAREKLLVQSVSIPRAVTLLGGGTLERVAEDSFRFHVEAKLGDESFGIVQSPYMLQNAKTTRFEHELVLERDCLRYKETTVVDIYGKTFEHTDENTLRRVREG